MPENGSTSKNIYESGQNLEAEADRLRSFDKPTQVSIGVIGEIDPNQVFLDIGAGVNKGLQKYVSQSSGIYIPLDIRHSFLSEHKDDGPAIQADVRELPMGEQTCDIVHARFLLAHLAPDDRAKTIHESLRVTKPEGKSVFIDYDWAAVQGSEAMNRFRDFTLVNSGTFDPAYGAHSFNEISDILGGTYSIKSKRVESPKLYDYGPVLGLREISLRTLEQMQAHTSLIDEINSIFDALSLEAASENPPGFYMPDFVCVTATKPPANS